MSGREFWHPPHLREIRHHQREREAQEQAHRDPPAPKPPLRCSFCYKTKAEVEEVWPSKGTTTAICSECIEVGYKMLVDLRRRAERTANPRTPKPPA